MAAMNAETSVPFDVLAAQLAGEIRTDRLSRTLYATDASIYEIIPDAVVMPKTADDVARTVQFCAQHKLPVTGRGGGTGLHGGCINRGIIIDFTRYMNRVLEFDPQRRVIRVEPGVVLDELNALLARHGLQFPPDVATSSRATVGGMIANNSCGAHSMIYGRTVDHVIDLDLVLADGSQCRWGRDQEPTDNPLAARCANELRRILNEQGDLITERFPKVSRSNGGYALDRLQVANANNGPLNAAPLLSGSEGTLCVMTAATLNVIPLPKCKGLVNVHYDDLIKAFESVPTLLTHQPAAIELVDKFILDATKDNPAMQRRRWFLQGDPAALLTVEFYDEDEASLKRRMDELVAALERDQIGYAYTRIDEPAKQEDVWAVRKGGTGLLMSQPGPTQPYDFVDDCAVDPSRLADYMIRLRQVLAEEGAEQAGYYGHASVGVVHVRPALNLRQQRDIQRLRRIGDRIASLVAEFGGAMTGEHGDGIVRSEWIERTYGKELVEVFRQIKQRFDPDNILNPGKIVDPLPMDGTLRYGVGYEADDPSTMLDFGKFGGMAGLADMCSGIGQCRQRLVGTMCPSYMATDDEQHATRARANALRVALSNKGLLDGLSDPMLDEVMDLCLSCKACKTECPTGTDIAKLKAEWLHHRNERRGVPRRSRLIASSIEMAAWGCHFAPLSNWVMQSEGHPAHHGAPVRAGPPRAARRVFARVPFRKWYARHYKPAPRDTAAKGRVVYFVDTWTNFYEPQVGRATLQVLEALGYEVLVPHTMCCGRPLISKGLLREARQLAEANVKILAGYAAEGLPIVGTEPSCISALLDELPELVRKTEARQIAARAQTVESFVASALRDNPQALPINQPVGPLIYHGHCHQKALTGTGDAMVVLQAATAGKISEINSGCCGMAGAFGHEKEHYEVARAVGEQRLFPAVRERGDASVAISGFSCRHQIDHHTDVRPRHVIEWLADALRP
jgi:FAD/FMN-containing dehydrogenase/Fe-S oxidoreductase